LGGILKGNVILVEGAAGVGKTLMGLEFIYRGITEYDEPGLILVFETSPKKLIRDAIGFGWNLDELQQRNKLKIIFTSPKVLDQELRSPDSLLLETAAEIGAQRIFIDGISLLRTLANGNGANQRRRDRFLPRTVTAAHRRAATREPDRDALPRGPRSP
jgi:circadian clock protein KaiC